MMNDALNQMGYLATPPGGSGPGVLVLHAWWGLNDFIKQVCDRLAAQGFVAFAPDMVHGDVVTTREAADELVSQVDGADVSALLSQAVAEFRSHPTVTRGQIGVVGFSFGAAWALELATRLAPQSIKAVTVYYGNYPGLEYDQTHAAFLGHFAASDEFEPTEEVHTTEANMREAGRDVTFHHYPGTGHWFAEEDRPDAYNAAAAALAWKRTIEFLTTTLT